jgi:hypothetical protein
MAGQGPAAQPAAVAVLVVADHLEELSVGSGRIRGLKNPYGSRRELDVVALEKVHGRAATKGIEPIDAGLAGHDQPGAGAMGLAQVVVREARARASRPTRKRPCWRRAAAGDKRGGDAAGTIGPVAGGKPRCSTRPHSRGSAGGGLGGGGWRWRGVGARGCGVARTTNRLLVSESR